MQEAQRKERNRQRIIELFPTFGTKIAAIIADLESQGLRPRIQDAWRSPEDQLNAFNGGFSKLKFGFHNVTGPNGEKQSLAVDMLDDDAPLQPTAHYLMRLSAAASRQGCQTGILWGLPPKLQAAVTDAIAAGNFDAPVKTGWDPTHVEPLGITVAEAKAGKRPA